MAPSRIRRQAAGGVQLARRTARHAAGPAPCSSYRRQGTSPYSEDHLAGLKRQGPALPLLDQAQNDSTAKRVM